EAVSLAGSVWKDKVRLIGTGAIAIAALWTLFELLKPVLEGMKDLIKHAKLSPELSQQDLSMKSIMLLFFITLLGLFATFYSFVSEANLSSFYTLLFSVGGTILAVLIGFFVAAACGYMAGLVGSSSSPISGIGLIAIITSSLVILLVGADIFKGEALSKFAIALAIFITSVILATAAISNDNLQDLKTGHLVGATPWKQQVSLLIG
ncbi:oligopeptide transporter, OPT family, partial [Campylobacter upsaliensis]|nr:oligopeptide transporter, OPT family [Campylobacter upsaliensis]